jgi:hypothetical protein
MQLSATPLVWLALAAVAPVEAPRPAETTLLRYRFTQGETVRQRIEQSSTLFIVKGEARQKLFNRSETEQRFKIVSIDEQGVATLRVTLDAARLEGAADDAEPTVYDSKEKNLPLGVAKAIGRPLADIRVRPDGSVESIKPLLPAAELDQVPGKLGLDGEAASNLFARFPTHPVAVGATWHDTVSTRVTLEGKLTQEIKILRQYRLESVTGRIARVEVKTKVVTPITEPALLVQLIQRTASGTIRFDMHAGRVVDRSLKVDNTEIGWHGADSSLRAVTSWTEQLVQEPTAVSSR